MTDHRNMTMAGTDVALARGVFDDVCRLLDIPPGDAKRRDNIAASVMAHVEAGRRCRETITQTVIRKHR